MNFALSQRRTDRHPVGLLVVVGLHVLLAAVLLSAKLKSGPAAPHEVVMVPVDPTPQVVQEPVDLPKPPTTQPHVLLAPLPPIANDASDAIRVAKADDTLVQPPVVVASIKGDDDTVHDPIRVLARAARINAGAAQCRPEYPAAAQRAGVTGTSRIRFSVDASGRITGSQILQSSGPTRENRLLDKAAAQALAQCPVQVGTDEMGRPVGATTDVDYVWTLNQ
jgi:periplasmic protein TonB